MACVVVKYVSYPPTAPILSIVGLGDLGTLANFFVVKLNSDDIPASEARASQFCQCQRLLGETFLLKSLD